MIYSVNPLVGVIDGFRWAILAEIRRSIGRDSRSRSFLYFRCWSRAWCTLVNRKNICGRHLMSTAISVDRLSKKYIISHEKQERYTALRDVIANGGRRIFDRVVHPFSRQEGVSRNEEFWALNDVSFDIQQGDRVGIIGRNGAGKSTLLKILSRVTEPTSGKLSIRGRVASLLEVGTGFHPELTGRENVFLNGAHPGHAPGRDPRRFDEIVAFAGVEDARHAGERYSSGTTRPAGLRSGGPIREPEILIVDEVLAVGDAAFQRNSLGKWKRSAKKAGPDCLSVTIWQWSQTFVRKASCSKAEE